MNNTKIIVVFKSKTGFTEKYAHWIAEGVHCDVISLDELNISDIARYDVVIFGGGIHAGRINGIKFIKNNISLLAGKKVIIFATGATPPIPEEIEKFRKDNVPSGRDIAFFYFQSGMDYAKMNGSDRFIMGALKTVLKMKKNKSDVEKGTFDAIQDSYDYSNQRQIEPLIDHIKNPSTFNGVHDTNYET